MSKLKVILTVGASASGKTTWANQFLEDNSNYVNLNRDDVRFNTFCDGVRDWSLYKFKRSNEDLVTKKIEMYADVAVSRNINIIVSDTNLNEQARAKWKKFAELNDYDYEEMVFDVDWTELVKRNENRQGGISLKVLRSQFLRMQEFLGRKKYTPDTSKPKAIIVDVDGTVASMEGIRKPFDWDKVHLDKPLDMVIMMVNGLALSGNKIIFLSGRDGSCYDKTRVWLRTYFGRYEKLLMRKADDQRKDFIIKEELFWQIADDYNIIGAIDDRHQVLRLWEEIGIENIINVNRGLYNEF